MTKICFFFLYSLLQIVSPLQNIFVSNSNQCSSTCDGSFTNPYFSLLSAYSAISSTNDSSITIHLISEYYYIEEPNIFLNPFQSQNFNFIKIKPFSCSNDTNIPCFSQVKISLKTQNISFLISKTMIIQNIVWNGADMAFLTLNQQINVDCMKNFSIDCCNFVDL